MDGRLDNGNDNDTWGKRYGLSRVNKMTNDMNRKDVIMWRERKKKKNPLVSNENALLQSVGLCANGRERAVLS